MATTAAISQAMRNRGARRAYASRMAQAVRDRAADSAEAAPGNRCGASRSVRGAGVGAVDGTGGAVDPASAVAAAEQAIGTATEVQEAVRRREEEQSQGGMHVPQRLPAKGGATGLAAFAAYRKGARAPWWLFQGVCDAWGFDLFRTEIRLLTVSENATFVVLRGGKPYGVVRVSQPGYVGGPLAVQSEIAWMQALADVDGVNVSRVIPLSSGFNVAEIKDESGTAWTCVCTAFVEGAVLEDLPDPSSFYRTIGRWAALFHRQARTWRPPEGFQRFTWDIPDMIGDHPRWGRWEDIAMPAEDFATCKRAEAAACAVIAEIPRDAQHWGLIHADLRPSNAILSRDGTLTVLDFDDCGYSYYLYDYAAALSFVEHEPYAPTMAKEWVAGYEEVTPLSSRDRACASALSMIRRLQMLGWTTNHYADALPDGLYEAQAPGAVYCAKRYLENPTWLLD